MIETDAERNFVFLPLYALNLYKNIDDLSVQDRSGVL